MNKGLENDFPFIIRGFNFEVQHDIGCETAVDLHVVLIHTWL